MTALVALVVVFTLVVCGVLTNVYLYSHGALAKKMLPGWGEPENISEEQYYAHVGSQDESTELYMRRVVSVFFMSMIIIVAILGLFFWQTLLS